MLYRIRFCFLFALASGAVNAGQLGTRNNPFLIFQKDLPKTIDQSGFYAFAEDISFAGSSTVRGARGSIGIAIDAVNVDLSLANHTLALAPTVPFQIVGIATLNFSSNISIHSGTIAGESALFEASSGILVQNNMVHIKDIQILNMTTIPQILNLGLGLQSSGIFIQGADLPTATSPVFIFNRLYGVIIERCNLSGNGIGISISNHLSGVTIKDTTIGQSTSFGIAEPARSEVSSNVYVENCSITDTGANGVFATFNQSNWYFKNCRIYNSTLTGISLQGSQNFKLEDCQIYGCGAYGILQSIRNSLNIEISNTKVANVIYEAARIDNVENLRITNSQFTNYASVFNETVNATGITPSGIPINVNNTSYPVVSLQDITNGLVSEVQMSSTTGTSDGLFVRNCSTLLVDKCAINIYANQSSPMLSGINLLGGVLNAVIQNCVIGGSLAIGVNISKDEDPLAIPATPMPGKVNLNGFDTGVTVKGCEIANASLAGINVVSASNNVILKNRIINCLGDGIAIDPDSFQNSVRGNTLINNGGLGINNASSATANQFYGNFAQGNNGGNFSTTIPTDLIEQIPTKATGPLANIDV